MCINEVNTSLDDEIQPVMDYFKNKYKSDAKLLNSDKCLPYQSKRFINPVILIHQTNEICHDDSHNYNFQDKECKDFWMIFNPNFYASNKIPNKLLIEGATGMGKSTVAKEIAYRWAENLLLRDVHLLVLLHAKHVPILKIANFEQLLQYCYVDKDRASKCAEHFINTQGRHLMIIFDGYDEMTTLEQQKCDNFFINLLHRKYLPHCYVIVTSIPYVTACLHQYCDCRVEILGLTKVDRLNYFRENLSNEKFQVVTKFLQANTIIDRTFYTPLCLINFISLVKYNIPFPKTLTELTGNTIRLIITLNKQKVMKDHLDVSISRDEEVDKIVALMSSFAYEMLDKEQFVFSETQIKNASIQDENGNLYGLLKSANLNVMQNIQFTKFYDFVHSSVHEYLAAYFLSTRPDITQAFALRHTLLDRKYFGFWTIYIGLTKGNNFPLDTFLSNQSTSKKNLLEYRFPGIAKGLKIDKISCLQLYEMFLEAPDDKMKESLRSIVDNDTINLSGEILTTADMEIVSYYITRSHIIEWQMIDLSNCNVDDGGFHVLCQLSGLEDWYEIPTIKCLNISNNRICRLSTLFNLANACKIIKLLASNNTCKDDHYIRKDTTLDTLEILDLSSNQLENKDVATLCKVLCMHKNLKELKISNSFITEDITKPLVTSILQWNNFEKFECEGNCFQDDNNSIEVIQFAIQQIKFHGKKIVFDSDLDHINYFLVMLECASDLSVEESNFIAKISEVTNLSLDCTDRPKQSTIPILTIKASQSFQKFDSLLILNLSGICISNDVADVLAVAFSSNLLSLQHLLMNNCNLNSNIVIKFMNYLKYAKFINTIQMNDNLIDDEATEALVVAFLHWNLQSIKCINLEKNPISLKLFQFVDSLMVKSLEDFRIDFSYGLEDTVNFVKLMECMSNVSADTSIFISNLVKINTLNLGYLQENKAHDQVTLTQKCSEFLQQFEHLTTVDISGIKIDKGSVDTLSDAFATKLKLLKCLIMNGCGLDSKSAIKLVENLHHTKTITEIQLCNNFIDDEATEKLIIAILYWNSIEVIKLENNLFSEESIITIQFLLSYFDHNELFDKGTLDLNCELENLKSFVTLLHCMNTVDTKNSNFISLIVKLSELYIDLVGCENKDNVHIKFTVDGLEFFQRFVNLQYLHVSYITIDENSADVLGTALGSNLLTLEYLFMTYCRITSKSAIVLVKQLQKNRNITTLDLTHNLIGDEATKAIVTAIFQWKYGPKVSDNTLSTSAMEIINFVKKFSFNCGMLRCYWESELFITILQYANEVPILGDSILKNISEIQGLELCYTKDVFKDKVVELTVDASKFFLRFVNLTSLVISTITIPKNSMSLLAEAFASNLQCVKQLILNECALTSEITIILMNKLRRGVDLEELQLCDNYIDDKASDIIVATIFFWNSLKILKLDNNQFTLKSIILFQFITKQCLGFSELSIDYNGDLDKVNLLITLLECANDTPLGNISKIAYLYLDCFNKQVTDNQLELTVNAAKYFQQFTNLVKLNISGTFVSEQSSDMLAIAFGSNLKSLESVIMNGCKITSKVVVKLVIGLHHNKNIREIQFCNNSIYANAIEILANAIFNWDALEVLKLDKNQFVHEYEILSMFLMLTGQQSEFITLMENMNYTYWKDFFVIRTFILLFDYASNHTGKKVSHFTNVVSKMSNLSLYCMPHKKPINADIELELTVGAATFFQNFINVVNLNLSGIIINEGAADILCQSFDFNKLQSLQMNNCKLTSKSVIKFLDMLKCSDIYVFEIQSNCIDDDATSPLIIAVLHWNSLRTISLEGNSFTWRFHSLFRFMMNFLTSSRKILTYSGNLQDVSTFTILLEHMKDVSSKHSRLVKNVCEIKDLYFHCSDKFYLGINHNNQQMKPLYHSDQLATDTQLELSPDASLFFQRFVSLTNLSINGIIVNEKTADNMLVAFSNNIQTLQCVALNYCGISSKIAIKFASKLQKAKNIKEFQLCNNIIDDEATTALVVAILHWNLLTLLEVDNNKFSNQSMDLLVFVSKSYFMKYPLSSNCTSIECRYGGSTSMLTLLDILKNVST